MRAVEGEVIVSMLYVTRYDVYEHSRCFLGDCTNVHSYNNHNSHPRLMTDTEKPCDAPVEEGQTVISLTVMVSSESPGDDHGQEDLTEDISPDGMESFKAMFEKGRQEVYEKACGITKRQLLGHATGHVGSDTSFMDSDRAIDSLRGDRSTTSGFTRRGAKPYVSPFSGKTIDDRKAPEDVFGSLNSNPDVDALRPEFTTGGSAPDIGGKVDYTEDRAAEAREAEKIDNMAVDAPYSQRDRSADKSNYDRDLANEIFYRDSAKSPVSEGFHEPDHGQWKAPPEPRGRTGPSEFEIFAKQYLGVDPPERMGSINPEEGSEYTPTWGPRYWTEDRIGGKLPASSEHEDPWDDYDSISMMFKREPSLAHYNDVLSRINAYRAYMSDNYGKGRSKSVDKTKLLRDIIKYQGGMRRMIDHVSPAVDSGKLKFSPKASQMWDKWKREADSNDAYMRDLVTGWNKK